MKNSIRITALIICAILLTASFTVIPSYAYYKEPGMEWVDDYSEFPDSERYLCDNIENYFVSAAYDLRHNGYTNFEEQGYKLNFMTTAEFYQTCVPKDENGNIVFPPLAASFPRFTNLLSSYVAGQTELSEKMLWFMRSHSLNCIACRNLTTQTCEFESVAIQLFLSPWTLYQNGNFYTWTDICEMTDEELTKIDTADYSFMKYISSIKEVLLEKNWWKDEYTQRYQTLFSHLNDWENSLEDKSTFTYNSKQVFYKELDELVELYGTPMQLIKYSDSFDFFSADFENAMKNAPKGAATEFVEYYCNYISELKNSELYYDNKYSADEKISWNDFMVLFLNGNTQEYDGIVSELKKNNSVYDDVGVAEYAPVFAYFEKHPISKDDIKNEINRQFGITHMLSDKDVDKISAAISTGTLYELAMCFVSKYQFIVNPTYSPISVKYIKNQNLYSSIPCVEPQRALDDFKKSYNNFKTDNPSLVDESMENKYRTIADYYTSLINDPPITSEASAFFAIASVLSLVFAVFTLSAKHKKLKTEN